MTDLKTLVRAEMDRAGDPMFGLDDVADRRDRKRQNQRLTAGVIGIAVFAVAVWIVTSGGPFDRGQQLVPGGAGTGPRVTGPPLPTVAPIADDIVGLPSSGATPSTPKHGRLVMYMEGSVGGSWASVRVYADGRVIWGDMGGYLPSGAPTAGATGFVEQQLTPGGVDFLHTWVLSTGLFEDDLGLLLDGTGFLSVEVRNGDRLVSVTWAIEENNRVGSDAPLATSEQASALEGIYALLSNPASWPSSAWEDQDPEVFVPPRYQVWLRVFPDQGPGPDVTVGEREVALLPAPAADLLRRAKELGPASYEMATEDARTFAEALVEAGLEPLAMPMGEAAVRFSLEHPDHPGNPLFVLFGPVLPHGEAVFLGPG